MAAIGSKTTGMPPCMKLGEEVLGAREARASTVLSPDSNYAYDESSSPETVSPKLSEWEMRRLEEQYCQTGDCDRSALNNLLKERSLSSPKQILFSAAMYRHTDVVNDLLKFYTFRRKGIG